jgi:hypothetical protein
MWIFWPNSTGNGKFFDCDVCEAGVGEELREGRSQIKAVAGELSGFFERKGVLFASGGFVCAVVGVGAGVMDFKQFKVTAWGEIAVNFS